MNTLAVVILSGGLDSATALGIAAGQHEDVHTISFDYGQRHGVELMYALSLAKFYDTYHKEIKVDPLPFRGGVLTTNAPVPAMRYDDLKDGEMSPTYVPFRNGNLISMAAAYADGQLREGNWNNALLYCGMHSEDAAGFAYADCTPEFLGAMASAVYIGTYQKVRLHALFQHTTKSEIIKTGVRLCVPYHLTHSCYRGERPACGECSTCQARLEAFGLAGYKDPLEYANGR